MVPPASHRISRVPWYSGSPHAPELFPYWILTISDAAFQQLRVTLAHACAGPTTPAWPKPRRFGLFPVRSPLLRESRLISLRQGTEMFQFPCCPPAGLWIQHGVSRHHSGRVAPLGDSGLLARMQLPLNVSPVSASVFGLQRLGILLVLSIACSSVLFSLLLSSASAKLK